MTLERLVIYSDKRMSGQLKDARAKAGVTIEALCDKVFGFVAQMARDSGNVVASSNLEHQCKVIADDLVMPRMRATADQVSRKWIETNVAMKRTWPFQ